MTPQLLQYRDWEIEIDFGQSETLRKLADLPFYGYAEAIIRRADPMWKVPDEVRIWIVHLERGEGECPHCGCDCNTPLEKKTVEIEARSEKDATEAAETEWPSWSAVHVEKPKIATADLPPSVISVFARRETVQ